MSSVRVVAGRSRLADALPQVVAGGGGIDGVRGVLTGRAAKGAVRAALERLTDGSVRLGPARVRRAKFKPGRRLDAYYDVVLDARSGPRARSVMVRWTPAAPADEPAAPDAAERADARLRGGAPFRRLVDTDTTLGMSIQISPFDPEFPQLARLCDPRHVEGALRQIADERRTGPRGRATSSVVTTVRYRPGERHVLRIDRRGEAGPGAPNGGRAAPSTLFAKLYRPGGAERAWRVATTVSDWLADGPPGFVAARPLGVLGGDDVLVYERCDGKPLWHWLRPARSGTDGVAGHLQTIGAGLRTLQRPPGALAADLRVHTFAGELRAVASSSEHIGVLLPTTGGVLVQQILDRCAALEETLPREEPVFAHGDFKLDHVWLAAGRITLIDHDSCTVADPALDVGKFLADLHWWTTIGGSPSSVGEARDAFLNGYGTDAPAHRIVRARLYEVLILTKATARRLPLWDAGWAARTQLLVERASALLATLERDVA